ncbi:MAG TPA: helix-turn-helix domain-containing protein [Nitrospira sp.]
MTRMAEPTTEVLTRGRQKKFTPERIQQIKNLVEQGTSREKIAELIGVTVGSLQVTCSRLGISLRQPKADSRAGLLRREEPPHSRGIAGDDPSSGNMPLPLTKTQSEESQPGLLEQAQASTACQEDAKRADEGGPVNFAIWMQYRGQQRTTELALSQQTVRQLAFEAEFRNMRIGEFVGEVIAAMLRKNLLQAVLEQKKPWANPSRGE